MPALRPAPRRALPALLAALLAGCSPERPTEPGAWPPPLPDGLAARAIAVRVDVRAGTLPSWTGRRPPPPRRARRAEGDVAASGV